MKTTLYTLLIMLIALPILAIAAGQLGFFAGSAPSDLGVQDGRLKGLSNTRNSVSSQAKLYEDHPMVSYANMAPLPSLGLDGPAAMSKLVQVLTAIPNVRITQQQPDYVRAEAATPWLGFVDDMEFWFNPSTQVIELRSASRLGREDFGVNRKRMEMIRKAWEQ